MSDGSPYVEALFRTAQYRLKFPIKGFADLDTAHEWAPRFVRWYNRDHCHSGIRYVSLAQHHAGQDRALLTNRHDLWQCVRQANPRRVSHEAEQRRQTSDWTPVGAVALNPEKDTVIQAAIASNKHSGSIGEPAFPARSGSAQAMERNDGDERSGATQSHA